MGEEIRTRQNVADRHIQRPCGTFKNIEDALFARLRGRKRLFGADDAVVIDQYEVGKCPARIDPDIREPVRPGVVRQCMNWPPSTLMVWPEMKSLPFDIRNITAPARSSGY